jgi:hypothetical protein
MTGTALTAFAGEPSMIFEAHREIDEDIPLRIGDSVDACLLEENAGLLAEGLLPLWQLRDVGCDRSGLTAGNGEVGRILVETKRLAPSAFAGPRDEASDARHLGIVEVADTTLSFGESRLNVVLTQARSSGEAIPDAERPSAAAATSTHIIFSMSVDVQPRRRPASPNRQ